MRKMTVLLLMLAVVLCSILPAWAEDAASLRGYSKSAGYEYVLFGSYPTEADGTVAPILWRVLKTENREAYLLSEYILFGAPVHGDYDHYKGWETSDLYQYLNNVFLNDAFTAEEQAVLLIRTEDNALVTLLTKARLGPKFCPILPFLNCLPPTTKENGSRCISIPKAKSTAPGGAVPGPRIIPMNSAA